MSIEPPYRLGYPLVMPITFGTPEACTNHSALTMPIMRIVIKWVFSKHHEFI
ncbi:hypothetical protein [Vibrio gallaecicus]|uniref:hypothetical protein n=1 Tax=Vibrio gallaecicus TaxID=552386 RepID=UPI0025B32A46|nr:hypothetical protein [Vibrio gallaecicus]MDN3616319.1 hypothetical protein [Vibrio gallaecicus]